MPAATPPWSWMHFDGSNYVVESAYRPEGGEWEAPTLVSQPGEEGGNPHVALDADGDSLVAWRGEDEGEEFVRAAYRPAGGSWAPPATSRPPAKGRSAARRGRPERKRDRRLDRQRQRRRATGSSTLLTSRPAAVGSSRWNCRRTAANSFPSDVVFDTGGNAALIWQRWDGDHNWCRPPTGRPAKNGSLGRPLRRRQAGRWTRSSSSTPPATRLPPTATRPRFGSARDSRSCEGEEAELPEQRRAGGRLRPRGLPEVELEVPAEGHGRRTGRNLDPDRRALRAVARVRRRRERRRYRSESRLRRAGQIRSDPRRRRGARLPGERSAHDHDRGGRDRKANRNREAKPELPPSGVGGDADPNHRGSRAPGPTSPPSRRKPSPPRCLTRPIAALSRPRIRSGVSRPTDAGAAAWLWQAREGGCLAPRPSPRRRGLLTLAWRPTASFASIGSPEKGGGPNLSHMLKGTLEVQGR